MKKTALMLVMSIALANLSAQVTGSLIQERWDGEMSFEQLSAAENPDVTTTIYELKIPRNVDQTYSSRVKGYIVPQVSGNYIFWVSSYENSEFWLSSDHTAGNKTLAARVPEYTSEFEFTKYPDQKSETYALVAGESYYFELLHRDSYGNEHAEVAWTQPGEDESIRNLISTANISQTPNDDNTLKNILTFIFNGLNYPGICTIDHSTHTVDISISSEDDPAALTSSIVTSLGSTISPVSGSTLDYSNPITYTVTAADMSTQDYTVTVTQLPLQTETLVTRFYLDPLLQEAVIDNNAGTISYDYFVGYSKQQSLKLEISLFASATVEDGIVFDVGSPPSTITITAQNGDTKTYDIIANGIVGAQGFSDDFSTAEYLDNWEEPWNDSYLFDHDAAGERLQLQMAKVNWSDTRFNFPESMNLYDYPLVRLKATASKPVNSNGIQIGLVDAEGNGARDWRTNMITKLDVPNQVYEIVHDFSSKFITYDHVELGEITEMYFDVNRGNTATGGGSDALIFIDDFQVGTEALPNNKPGIDQPQSPDWTYLSAGAQSVTITGLDDGNPNRDEILTVTARSSNQAVVKNEDIIVTYDGSSETAEISYTGTERGFAEITIYVQDDRGTAYTGESDIDSVKVIAQFRDDTPGVNNMATFGIPFTPDYFLNTGQNVIIIPNVDDGEEDEKQEIIFTLNNLNPELITVDSLVYNTGDIMAIIYFTELGAGGTAMMELSCQDKVNFDAGGDDIFTLTFAVEPGFFDNPGTYYGATDVQQWQDEPYKDPSLIFKEGYPIIWPNADIQDHCKKDLFWGKMWGYIIPPESGEYQFFSSTEGEGIGNFYLSSDHLYENLPDTRTAANGSPSTAISLDMGKPYYFEAYHKEIINDYHLTISWTGPGFTQTILAPPYVVASLDLEKPTTPENFTLDATGTNEAIISWNAASDDGAVAGYKVILDGYVYMDSVFMDTKVNIKGLETETGYQVTVVSVDMFSNHSLPAAPLSFSTWPEDGTPPEAPANVVISDFSMYSATVAWDEAVDNETEIFGYNIYVDGSVNPANLNPVQSLHYKASGLQPETQFSFEVTALDASLNESERSNAAVVMTKAFNWDDEEEEAMLGQVDVTLLPMTKSTGFAVEHDEYLGALLVSNKVSYNFFESQHFKDGASAEDLAKVRKVSSNVTINAETVDPYDGAKSLKLTTSDGGYFRNNAEIKMSPLYTYLVKFAAKKDANYSSEAIQLRVLKTTGGTVVAHSSTVTGLTNEWQEFEVEFPGIENALQSWWVEWGFNAAGDVYFDNVEMHIKDFYNEGSKFTSVGMAMLKDLDVAGIRWGGIDANYLKFSNSAGPNTTYTLTFGDFVHISNQLGGYALLCSGIHDGGVDADGEVTNDPTDFYSDKTTYTKLMEYLGGDGSTEWGARRIAEGYTNSLIEESNAVIIEFGNEVWGSTHGVSSFASVSSYPAYTAWSQDATENYVKQSPYYNPEKVITTISGRSPDLSYGLNEAIYNNPNDDIDWISLSGYMGGNLDYEPGVDPGETELDYHMNGYDNFYSKINGLQENWKNMLIGSERIWPIYMYEGNMSTPSYHGTLGQAITFGDYYATAMEHGVVLPSVFCLEGGQWRLIDDLPTLRKRPMYYVTKLFNKSSRGGVVLKTITHSMDSIYNAEGTLIDLPSIGAHAYTEGEEYAVVLFSRNFESDYHIMVNLPDDIGEISSGKMYTLTGESYNSGYVSLDTADIVVSDSMIVTVPKHSMVVLRFMADDKNLTAPLGYAEIDQIQTLEISSEDDRTVIDGKNKFLEVFANISPEDVFLPQVRWEVLNNDDGKVSAYRSPLSMKIKSKGVADGTITVVAKAMDGSGLTDELDISLVNQTGIEDKPVTRGIKLYPNPAKNILYVEIADQNADICIFNVQGAAMLNTMALEGRNEIDLSGMKDGIYVVRVKTSKGVATERFVKQ